MTKPLTLTAPSSSSKPDADRAYALVVVQARRRLRPRRCPSPTPTTPLSSSKPDIDRALIAKNDDKCAPSPHVDVHMTSAVEGQTVDQDVKCIIDCEDVSKYEERKLYGVFEGTSDGAMDIVPMAFSSSGKLFSAQDNLALPSIKYVGNLFVKDMGKPMEILKKLNEMTRFDPNEEIELHERLIYRKHMKGLNDPILPLELNAKGMELVKSRLFPEYELLPTDDELECVNDNFFQSDRSDARELAASTQYNVHDINETICLHNDNEQEEVDPNVAEREVESDVEEDSQDDEDEFQDDDEDDAELNMSSSSDDEYR
ncbi:hypothetical protein Taro_018312 [Colocasia esculenta]|uniref:DCD domain-containing protein n=1 Tax=Colocasia esculenta TaxID=4460 RepID=A0A843V226_COLES|nr:hypothetical protein [Colocasia esculenta]